MNEVTGTPLVDGRSSQLAMAAEQDRELHGQPAAAAASERLYDAAKDQATKLDDRRRLAAEEEQAQPATSPATASSRGSGERLYNQAKEKEAQEAKKEQSQMMQTFEKQMEDMKNSFQEQLRVQKEQMDSMYQKWQQVTLAQHQQKQQA